MASHSKRLPHLGSSLPNLPAVQGFSPHFHSIWRLLPPTCPLPTHPHRRSRSSTIIGRISILLHCSGPLHALAGSIPYSRHHSGRTLLSGWISRFGCPQTIITDQGRQFESQLFHNLAKLCGIHLCRTSPRHPAANGLVERLHRTLKAVIMCHADEQWTEALLLVLLGIRTAFKEDLQSSAAELVYGETLRVTGELLVPASPRVEPSAFIQQLRRRMDKLRPTPAARYSSPVTSMHRDLTDSTHVFLQQDAIRCALDHHTAARTDKTFKIVVRGRQVTISADRVKPAYMLDGTQNDTTAITGSPPAEVTLLFENSGRVIRRGFWSLYSPNNRRDASSGDKTIRRYFKWRALVSMVMNFRVP